MATQTKRSRLRTEEGPSPEEVRAARESAGLTQAEAGALVHSPWHSWNKWETDASSDNSRHMHPATWDLFRIKIAARGLRAKGLIDAKTLKRLEIEL
jgi:DNA-binding XRE family transcriptional regulator